MATTATTVNDASSAKTLVMRQTHEAVEKSACAWTRENGSRAGPKARRRSRAGERAREGRDRSTDRSDDRGRASVGLQELQRRKRATPRRIEAMERDSDARERGKGTRSRRGARPSAVGGVR